MRKTYTRLLALGVAAISLASCSRATYSFNNTAPAYLGTARAHAAPVAATPAEGVTEAAATSAAVLPVASAASVPQPRVASARAKRRAAKVAAVLAVVAQAQPTATTAQAAKAATKATRHRLLSPKEAKAEGKSQLVALLLCLFLGGLGIHRFYLGYTGLGILELLTFGVFGILSLIDLIRIIIGDLKPKNGEYAKKL